MMISIERLEERLGGTLDALDALASDLRGEAAEALEELNAEFEDALFMLSQIDPGGADAAEELDEALCEFEALCEGYRAIATDADGIGACAGQLAEEIEAARRGTAG